MKQHRTTGILGVVAVAGLIAACAAEAPPPPPPPAPPPPAAAPAPMPPPPPPPAAMNAVVTARVHLHAGPALHSRVVATLHRGTPVHPTGERRGVWRRVETPAGSGWVMGRYLRPA